MRTVLTARMRSHTHSSMATEYANLLEQQQAEIEQLEAERIAAEEEARRQAEAEAAASCSSTGSSSERR